MNDYLLEDTIAAISTPIGKGAISIIRLSGANAFKIVTQIFEPQKEYERTEPKKALYGHIYDEQTEIDEVIVIKFKKPFSYTKEDMVEINCHGGMFVTEKILSLILEKDVRLAQPGEFTLRAFMNGRFDLSQAEAVADLIQSKTEVSLQSSLKQLQGNLSQQINEIRDLLIKANSLLELELDFSEEDIEFVERSELKKQIVLIKSQLEKLIQSFEIGRIAREGVKLVIVGKPNVGKSSLLNVLSREDHAIVTEIPGTTRDALEVQLDIHGILFRIVDTAGIKITQDPIEKEGIRRTKKHLESSDIIVHLFDGSNPLDKDDEKIIQRIDQLENIKLIRVINKIDLRQKINKNKLFEDNVKLLNISALKCIGINEFERELVSLLTGEEKELSAEVMVTNQRHWALLKKALENLEIAEQEIEKKMSSEFISVYLREALDNLGEITGTVTSEDILNNIFKNFCVGK